mgnify:CR=1 FL=1
MNLNTMKALASKWGVSASFAIAALLVVAVSGCSLDDMVKVSVPKSVAQATGVEEQVSLSSVDLVWDDWEAYVVRNTNAFQSADDRARERLATLNSLTGIGIGALESSIPGGAPLGGIALSALTLMTGLFLKRPGTDRAVNREKEDSYNAGLAIGRADALDTIREARA